MTETEPKPMPGRYSSIRVIEFFKEECPFSNRSHTWRQFNTFRNAVLGVLSSYGGVAPVGRVLAHNPLKKKPERICASAPILTSLLWKITCMG
jgi:hypothetical protein